MWLNKLRLGILGQRQKAKTVTRPRRTRPRLQVEQLENRLTPATFNAGSVALLITDIGLANTNGAAANTINLTGSAYTLTSVNNNTNGPNGLPVIDSTVASTLTINGEGNTIENTIESGFWFTLRFFEIAAGSGGSLILKNIELQGGTVRGSGTSAEGGAIFNNGTLHLDGGVQLLENFAIGTGLTSGGAGDSAAGGGIYSTAGSTLKFNGDNLIEACYAYGGSSAFGSGKSGGNAMGGGIFADTTTATSLSSATGTVVEGCQVFGGAGGLRTSAASGPGGSAMGGGLFVSGSSSTAKAVLTGFTFDNDDAFGGYGGVVNPGKQGGNGGAGGNAFGGGIYASGGTVTDTSFINVLNCQAQGGAGGYGGTGTFTSGGNGGIGGNAFGGGIDASGTTLTLSASPTIENNSAVGGGGGNGGGAVGSATTGGNGGNSGTGSGGGLYAAATGSVTVTLKNALVSNNTAEENRPGIGFASYPGFGGAGGSYTGGFGGGIYLDQNATLTSDTITLNSACGGLIDPDARFGMAPAGTGKSGGVGGNGATSAGGGLFVAGGTVTVTSCTIEFDKACGGLGGSALNAPLGAPGANGAARGGGVDVQGGTVTITKSMIESNSALGGTPALTMSGRGASGGAAAGGGLYAGGGTIHLTFDVIQGNLAATGGGDRGFGGGIYLVTGTTLTQDSFTSSDLTGNTASDNPGSDNLGTGAPMG